MIDFFRASRFTRIENTFSQRHNVILSIVSLFGTALSGFYFVYHLMSDSKNLYFADLVVFTAYAVVYTLNEKKRFDIAKSVFLLFANLSLFIYAKALPTEYGGNFFFFVLIAVTPFMIGPGKNLMKVFFVLFPIFLAIVSELFDFSALKALPLLQDYSSQNTYFINLVLGLISLTASTLYMDKLNREVGEKLSKANEELEMFFYRTSHDLKGPLASARGLLGILDLAETEKEQTEIKERMVKSLDNLDEILHDLIEATKVRSGAAVRQEVDLEDLIKNITDHETETRNKRAQIKTDLQVKLINSDKTFLKLILRNLISNSIKYSRKETTPFIIIGSRRLNHKIEISVEDNGIGIEPEALDHIFEMFFRATDKKETGFGLGLYIVKNAVEKLDGSIEVRSSPGVGTTFRVFLPN